MLANIKLLNKEVSESGVRRKESGGKSQKSEVRRQELGGKRMI
jgi:hypothetical protein